MAKTLSYGVAMIRPKVPENIGIMLRNAYIMGADFFVLIGKHCKVRPHTDTPKAHDKLLILYFDTLEEAKKSLWQYSFVGAEQGGESIYGFEHPNRAVYVLGNEGSGLLPDEIELCDSLVEIDSDKPVSLNVAQAGGIITYDRRAKLARAAQA